MNDNELLEEALSYGYESVDEYLNALQENQDNLDIKGYFEDID